MREGGGSPALTADKNSKNTGLKTRHYDKRGLVGVGVVLGIEAGAGDEIAEGVFAAGAALGTDDEAVAIDDNVDGIGGGRIHGGEIGVFHHDDLAVAGMLLEIFFDGFLGFTHVDGKQDEAFAGEFMADFVDEGGFVGAEATPGGPELEEHHLAFDGFVGELFAGGGNGVEAGRGLFVLGCSESAKRGEDQYGERCSTQEDGSGHEEM